MGITGGVWVPPFRHVNLDRESLSAAYEARSPQFELDRSSSSPATNDTPTAGGVSVPSFRHVESRLSLSTCVHSLQDLALKQSQDVKLCYMCIYIARQCEPGRTVVISTMVNGHSSGESLGSGGSCLGGSRSPT